MALAIRMSRGGRANLPFYRIVVADKRFPRDGRYLEKLGTYDPRQADSSKRLVINKERIEYWLKQGAKPSDRIQRFLSKEGMMEFPKWNESPKKSAPKTKAQERAKAKAEKAAAKEEAAKKASEAPAEAAPAAEAPAAAPAEKTEG
jgi:small subunit ribosomal protein S16